MDHLPHWDIVCGYHLSSGNKPKGNFTSWYKLQRNWWLDWRGYPSHKSENSSIRISNGASRPQTGFGNQGTLEPMTRQAKCYGYRCRELELKPQITEKVDQVKTSLKFTWWKAVRSTIAFGRTKNNRQLYVERLVAYRHRIFTRFVSCYYF